MKEIKYNVVVCYDLNDYLTNFNDLYPQRVKELPLIICNRLEDLPPIGNISSITFTIMASRLADYYILTKILYDRLTE